MPTRYVPDDALWQAPPPGAQLGGVVGWVKEHVGKPVTGFGEAISLEGLVRRYRGDEEARKVQYGGFWEAIGIDPERAPPFLSSLFKEYGKSIITGEPLGLGESTNPLAPLGRTLQRMTREDYERFLAHSSEKGGWKHTPSGWSRTGSTSEYDPTNPADIPLRQKVEMRIRTDLAKYLQREPSEEELLITLVRLGHIPTPPLQGGPPPAEGEGAAQIRYLLSQPVPPDIEPGTGKGSLEVQRQLNALLYNPELAYGPDPVEESTILAPFERLDIMTRGAGRAASEGIAQIAEHTGRAAEVLSGSGEYKLPQDSPYRDFGDWMRGIVPERVLGETLTFAVPGVGLGPKGLRALSSKLYRAPATGARWALSRRTVAELAQETEAMTTEEVITHLRETNKWTQHAIDTTKLDMDDVHVRERFGGWIESEVDDVIAGRRPSVVVSEDVPAYQEVSEKLRTLFRTRQETSARISTLEKSVERMTGTYAGRLERSNRLAHELSAIPENKWTDQHRKALKAAEDLQEEARDAYVKTEAVLAQQQGRFSDTALEINTLLGREPSAGMPMLEEGLERLRYTHLPGYEDELASRLPLVTPAEARSLKAEIGAAKAEYRLQKEADLASKQTAIMEREWFMEDLVARKVSPGTPMGRAGAGGVSQPARIWANVRRAQRRLWDNPKGIQERAGGTETLADYIPVALLRSVEHFGGRDMPASTWRTAFADLLAHEFPPHTMVTVVSPEGERVTGRIASIDILEGALREGERVSVENIDPSKIRVNVLGLFEPVEGRIVSAPATQTMVRYTEAGLIARKDLARDAISTIRSSVIPRRVARAAGGTPFAESDLQHLVSAMREPETIFGRIVAREELDAGVQKALAEFHDPSVSHWLALDQPAEAVTSTWSRLGDVKKGMAIIRSGLAPPQVGEAQKQEWVESLTWLMRGMREYVMEHGPAIKDEAMRGVFDRFAENDPIHGLALMLGRMTPNRLREIVDGVPGLPPLLDEAARLVQGRAITTPEIRGLVDQYVGMEGWFAVWTNVVPGGLIMDMRDIARATLKRQPSSTFVEKVLHPARSIQVWRGRNAQGAEDLGTILRQGFNRSVLRRGGGAVGARLRNRWQGIGEKEAAEALDAIAGDVSLFLEFPELWPKVSAAFKKFPDLWQAMMEYLDHGARVLNASATSRASANRYMLMRDLRDVPAKTAVGEKIIEQGDALDVVTWAARWATDNKRSIHDAIILGEKRALAQPLAYWQNILNARTADALTGLMLPGQTAERADLVRFGGRWAVSHLEKWPKDMHDSIRAFSKIMSPEGDVPVLTQWSQNVAMGVLVADLNLVSVQLPPMLSLLLPFKPHLMAKFVQEAWTVTTDMGFHAWLRKNFDEVAYNVSSGLQTGMSSYVAGPMERKLWFESVPGWAGKVGGQVRAFNDMQFDRWLLVMKTYAIREHLFWAKMLRTVSPATAMRFIRGTPGLEMVAKEAGGEAAYVRGLPEEIHRAAIRVVNNQMGGLSMKAQGIGSLRQAAEQIMLIVPAFFRAQAGMISTAVTRPHTVEGWMAINGLARETMFAAMVSYGFSLLTGNAHKWNYKDVTRADWMGVQLDDGWIPIIPRMAYPRMLARTVQSIVGLTDPTQAMESFTRGRFSPAVGGIYEQIAGEDFLGRKFENHWDRLVAGISSVIPIFAENITSDIRETVREKGWGGLSPKEIALETGLQYIGKNRVPRYPLEKLNEFSQAAYNEDWLDMAPIKRDKMVSANPQVAAAMAEWEYHQSRRDEPTEERVTTIFKDQEKEVNRIRKEKVQNPDGSFTTQEEDWFRVLTGDVDGDGWRENYYNRQGLIAERREYDLAQLKGMGFDLEKKHDELIARWTEKHSQADFLDLVQMAIWEVQSIQPEDFMEVALESGVPIPRYNWDAFTAARDAIKERFPDLVYQSAVAWMRRYDDEGITRYRAASQERRIIEEIPRYRTLTPEQGDLIDRMRQQFRALSRAVRAETQLPGAFFPMPEGVNTGLRRIALLDFQRRGLVNTSEDLRLAALAVMLEESPKLSEAMRNPAVAEALIAHPDVPLFYTAMGYWVPTHLRSRLPQEVLQHLGPYDPTREAEEHREEYP